MVLVQRKEFCVEPPSGLSEGQVGKWSVLFEGMWLSFPLC